MASYEWHQRRMHHQAKLNKMKFDGAKLSQRVNNLHPRKVNLH